MPILFFICTICRTSRLRYRSVRRRSRMAVEATHGRGYATEAVRVVVAWSDAYFRPARTACIIDPENLPSIRVAVKCGYREFQLTTYKGRPTIMFVREPSASP